MPLITVEKKVVAPAPLGESLEDKFHRLATAWTKATSLLSSSRLREEHPAYQEIIGLGLPVVPHLLRDMQNNETHWFGALSQITGANPIPKTDAGNIPLMVEAWLSWAREHGYQW